MSVQGRALASSAGLNRVIIISIVVIGTFVLAASVAVFVWAWVPKCQHHKQHQLRDFEPQQKTERWQLLTTGSGHRDTGISWLWQWFWRRKSRNNENDKSQILQLRCQRPTWPLVMSSSNSMFIPTPDDIETHAFSITANNRDSADNKSMSAQSLYSTPLESFLTRPLPPLPHQDLLPRTERMPRPPQSTLIIPKRPASCIPAMGSLFQSNQQLQPQPSEQYDEYSMYQRHCQQPHNNYQCWCQQGKDHHLYQYYSQHRPRWQQRLPNQAYMPTLQDQCTDLMLFKILQSTEERLLKSNSQGQLGRRHTTLGCGVIGGSQCHGLGDTRVLEAINHENSTKVETTINKANQRLSQMPTVLDADNVRNTMCTPSIGVRENTPALTL